MRLPHDRLFLWLAPLLFAGAVPDLAAQTWTTVWTPDGAPAVRPAAKGDTRDYNTNCYPCKEWADYGDGKGKWINYGTNTTPKYCAGDTNDYTCKVCDGNGGVTNASSTTTCDAGQGCGCCVDGKCWAPTPNCPDPLDIDFNLIRVGPCPCLPCVLGCVVPVAIPPSFDGNACYEACTWKPAPSSITIGYLEGLCPERCNATFNSTNDATTESNYCAVLAKLEERIAKEQQAIANPPDPADCDNPPPESYCFSDCMARHEAVHVEQLRCTWEDMESEIIDAISDISVPFDCDSAKTPEDAAAAMNEQVNNALKTANDRFIAKWNDPDIIRNQEIQAHQDTLECLQALRTALQECAANNGWNCDR